MQEKWPEKRRLYSLNDELSNLEILTRSQHIKEHRGDLLAAAVASYNKKKFNGGDERVYQATSQRVSLGVSDTEPG